VKGAVTALALAAAGLFLAGPAALAASRIDYLYIDASEGGGSGGHAAIAIGDRAFHFEHHAPGILRMRREPMSAIRYDYSFLENRTIEVSHVRVTENTRDLVLDEFNRRYLVQQQHLADHEAYVDDRRLLEAARARLHGRPVDEPLILEGAGFFFDEAVVPAPDRPEGRESGGAPPALTALRERVEAALGPGGLERAMQRIHAELGELAPDRKPELPAPLAADRLAPSRYGLGRRYRDGLLKLLALEVLRTARPLRPASRAGAELPRLAPADAPLVERLAGALEKSLVRLVQSERPDWGFPLLLGMARLIMLDETLRGGRWLVLDALPADAPAISRARLLAHPAVAPALRERVATDFDSALAWLRARDATAGFPEVEWTELESAGTRLAEVEGGLRAGRDLRMAWGAAVPARGAPHREVVLPAFSEDDLARALAVARAREAAHAAALERLYGYNLLTRNCVTEIFRTMEAAFARDLRAHDPALADASLEARVRAASVARLGGYIDPGSELNFIPAVSAAAVRSAYAVSGVEELPSHRKARLALMYSREDPVRVYLRESNTLTSTLYRRMPEDSAFLFFTDDTVAPRPLLGAANLLTGVGVAAAGLVMLPADGGDLLTSGLKGVLFSLPELAFFNIRKGSFPDLGVGGIERPAGGPGDEPGVSADAGGAAVRTGHGPQASLLSSTE
jgi:hypothetical protein